MARHVRRTALVNRYIPRSEVATAPLGSTGFEGREIGTNLSVLDLDNGSVEGSAFSADIGVFVRVAPEGLHDTGSGPRSEILCTFRAEEVNHFLRESVVLELVEQCGALILVYRIADIILDGGGRVFSHAVRIPRITLITI